MNIHSSLHKHLTCRKLAAVFMLIVLLAACAPSPQKPAPPAYWPTQGWQSTTPEEQGMDADLLAQMVEQIQQEQLNVHSLLIVRNGYLVHELYVYPYSAGQAHTVMSVTKSVIGTLVGIAIEQGYIQDIEAPLLDLLPDEEAANLDDRKKAITLEDLLTQTSGFDCPDTPAPGETSMEASENWVQFMLDQPVVTQPGTEFHYCSGATHLLSAVLEKATGMSAREFANQHLFGPLGIGPIAEERWPADPQGVSLGGYGLSLMPQEMAKLGLLYLGQGQWDGKAIVPVPWVLASTSGHANQGDKKEYGYLWWTDPQKDWYAALGRAGQHIFVYPAEDLVVVFTADLPYTNDADLIPLQELIDKYILPAVKSDEPLPANPDGLARLTAGIQALSQPQRMAPQPLPPIAAEISGKTYLLEENPFGWRSIIFTFEQGADEARVTIDGMRQIKFGLDNVYRLFSVENNTFPEALRGRWENQDTLVLEDIALGQQIKVISRIRFAGETLHIDWEEVASGTKVELDGTLDADAR